MRSAVESRGIMAMTPLMAALAGIVAVIIFSSSFGGTRYVVAVMIGAFAGFALYHASFGFTAAWRRIVTEKRGHGLRAQMLLLVLACAITYPLLAYGAPDLGDWVTLRSGGFVFSFGVAAAIGSFMFGMGMQLGGGCGSGTLFTVGGGSTRMVVTLAAFIAGSLIATAHLPWWNTLPRFDRFSLVSNFGPALAFVLLLLFAAGVYFWTRSVELKAHGTLEQPRSTGSLFRGPWAPVLGALALVVVSVATILTLGRPWGITSGFALWGAKIANVAGVDIASWPYWRGQMGRVERSVFADATSIMNFGIIFGAMAASVLAGKFSPKLNIGWVPLMTAIIGGLMMGYGARLSFGCNIGAYLGGIVSGSLHGWWWAVFAFAGSSIMARIKVRYGL